MALSSSAISALDRLTFTALASLQPLWALGAGIGDAETAQRTPPTSILIISTAMRPFLRAPLLAGVRGRLLAPALAAVLAAVAVLTHASGGDLAAATYRIDLFRQVGLALWDSNWYAATGRSITRCCSLRSAHARGRRDQHPLCDGCRLGLRPSRRAALRHARARGGRAVCGRHDRPGRGWARPLFARGTLALLALLVAMRRLWPLAVPLALAAALASPLAGAFLALAAATWFLADLPRVNWRAVLLGAAAVLPVHRARGALPGQGTMPFATLDFIDMAPRWRSCSC